jgi:DNA-binding SARP family transcriptional activator/tetratricopeptide (TPR) repeat protein
VADGPTARAGNTGKVRTPLDRLTQPLMRLPRTSLLGRLAGAHAPRVILLEAPTGYGKSWLIRKAASPGILRLRGELGPLADDDWNDPGGRVVIDDAHLLDADSVARLVDRIEDTDDLRLIVAGRILPDAVHEVTQLVDGLIIDATALAVAAPEIIDFVADRSATIANRVVEAADGCVRVIATALDQAMREPGADPIALASRMVRAANSAAMQQLGPRENAVIGLLARAPGIDRRLLDRLAGPGFVERALAAGVPLRRLLTGGLDLAAAASFRSAPVEPMAAAHLAAELVERDRPIEAIGLLLDAGAHADAARMVMDLSESVTDTVEPRLLLGLLARLGTVTEREPALLLLRAAATRSIGRVDDAVVDIDRAVARAAASEPHVRRRAGVEAARARLSEGRREDAVRAAEQALVDLGAGEEHTYARAYEVLAECAATSNARSDLQRAAECYRVAAAAWEGCGEYSRARACRRDLAMGVLVQLGRHDEALAQLGQLLATSDMSDAERSWTVLSEGFVLFNANRLESADARFVRVADVGYVHDNPRLIAAAAWGRALVAARRGDVDKTLRWVATAENTALTDADDVLGVLFLCDTATALGALGELDLASRYLDRALERRSVFPDQLATTKFILDARLGHVGDIDAHLRCTPPAEWWRVQLVAAHAIARQGDLDAARRLLADSERELVALGFSSAAALGEGRTHSDLQALLQRAPVPSRTAPPEGAYPPRSSATRRLRVIGGSMVVEDVDSVNHVPPGNPQRVVGVVVANGGSATFDQLSEAIWPGEDVDVSRARLRNVLLRLRRAVGDIVVRSGSGVRLADDLPCDLIEFERLALDALSSTRADPELAGRLASEAVRAGDGTVFAGFEYEEWAITARRSAEQRMIGLLDLLSVQAEDAGDLPAAQALAERALRLDRYTDSRYVRLAELLTLQHRVAAAIAVLDDAAEVAREIGGALPASVTRRRDDLVRRTATGS